MKPVTRPSKAVLLQLYTQEGLTDSQVAKRYGVRRSTVWRWRQHYGIEITTKQVYTVHVQKGD